MRMKSPMSPSMRRLPSMKTLSTLVAMMTPMTTLKVSRMIPLRWPKPMIQPMPPTLMLDSASTSSSSPAATCRRLPSQMDRLLPLLHHQRPLEKAEKKGRGKGKGKPKGKGSNVIRYPPSTGGKSDPKGRASQHDLSPLWTSGSLGCQLPSEPQTEQQEARTHQVPLPQKEWLCSPSMPCSSSRMRTELTILRPLC